MVQSRVKIISNLITKHDLSFTHRDQLWLEKMATAGESAAEGWQTTAVWHTEG